MPTIFQRKEFLSLAAVALVAFLVSASAAGNEKKTHSTTITVGEMCAGCVKQITARFDKEKSVSKISCDIKTRTVTLVPTKDVRLSPRNLWEILESIGKKPAKLTGPDGTFTSKPKKT